MQNKYIPKSNFQRDRDEWRKSLDKHPLIFTLAVGEAAVKNGLPPNGTRGHSSSLSLRSGRPTERPKVGQY